MDLLLSGKRAIVTGGSRGIGYAVAAALAAEGARVVVVARDAESLSSAAARLSAAGSPVLAIPADTRDDASVAAMVSQAGQALGGVDILVNGAAQPAGAANHSNLDAAVDDEVRIEVETKVLGYLRCARAVAPYMIEQGWGRIINISGLASRQAVGIAASLRNVAVAAMTKNLADEFGTQGINVSVVHPGLVVTERTPGLLAGFAAANGISVDEAEAKLTSNISIGRMVTADEVADVITFLASPRSVGITGDAVVVGGGSRGPIHY